MSERSMDGGPLRILCLSNMYPGAADPDYGAFIATMCDALERRGHAVERVVIDTRASGPARTPAKYLGLTRRGLPAARRADVIYAHYLFPTGAIAAACGRAARRPWVITAHGGDVRNLGNPVVRAASAPGLAGAAAVICVSRYLAAELRSSGLALPPIRIANMGVDLSRFVPGDRASARARLGVQGGGHLVVAVGGLTERKNPLRLLQAFARVREGDTGATLALVGDGPLRGAVHAGVRRLGLEAAVRMPGALPHAEVAEWMRAADLLAVPSTVEPLGVVALEAMASGRPVVATRVGGVPEVVGRAGTLVDPLDPRSIADGILHVLSERPAPELCRSLAAAHAVDVQAGRVADILRAAAGR